MNPLALIDKYYPEDNELKHILLVHSRSVADKALEMARKHPELNLDLTFIEEAAMLHDIGIFMTDADGIFCFGKYPYICHGYLGSELVAREGYLRHALVCERHTGAGLSLKAIMERKFYSKTKLDKEKSVEKARKSIEKHGEEGLARFDAWCKLFL